MIAERARRAVSGWSAATAATGSPMYRTTSLAKTGWSWLIRPYVAFPGTSLAVMTAWTPAMRSAPETSMDRIRAEGWGLRNVAPHAIESSLASDENSNDPFTFGMPSGRSALVPRTSRLRVVVMLTKSSLFVVRRPAGRRQRFVRTRCNGRCCPTVLP